MAIGQILLPNNEYLNYVCITDVHKKSTQKPKFVQFGVYNTNFSGFINIKVTKKNKYQMTNTHNTAHIIDVHIQSTYMLLCKLEVSNTILSVVVDINGTKRTNMAVT